MLLSSNRWFAIALLLLAWAASRPVIAQEDELPPDDRSFLLLLSHDEQMAYNSLGSETQQRLWRQRFWKERDPTPTTKRNERLEEHLRRVAYAKTFFRAPTKLGFDDRGRIYVKYGPPDDHYIDPAGDVTRGNESWAYYNFAGGLAFDFVDKNGFYISTSLDEALVAEGESLSWLDAVKRMYRARANLHPKYNKILTELDRLTSLASARDIRFEAKQAIDRVEIDTQTNQFQAPTDYFVFDYGGELLPIVFNTANFKLGGGKTRVEVYYALACQDLKYAAENGELRTTIDPVVAIYDHNYNLIARDSTRLVLSAVSREELRTKNFVNQFTFAMDPGQYLLFIRAQNVESERVGIYRMPLLVQNFDTEQLTLSDIQFSQRIRPASSNGPFVKNGLLVGPYPFHSAYRKRPISIYYEVYNLYQDAAGKTSYTVDYSVTVVKTKRGGIAGPIESVKGVFSDGTKEQVTSTVSREGTEKNAVEYIGFDLSELPPGTMELKVQVTDRVSGMDISATRRFELLE